jgi:hypothetical protein
MFSPILHKPPPPAAPPRNTQQQPDVVENYHYPTQQQPDVVENYHYPITQQLQPPQPKYDDCYHPSFTSHPHHHHHKHNLGGGRGCSSGKRQKIQSLANETLDHLGDSDEELSQLSGTDGLSLPELPHQDSQDSLTSMVISPLKHDAAGYGSFSQEEWVECATHLSDNDNEKLKRVLQDDDGCLFSISEQPTANTQRGTLTRTLVHYMRCSGNLNECNSSDCIYLCQGQVCKKCQGQTKKDDGDVQHAAHLTKTKPPEDDGNTAHLTKPPDDDGNTAHLTPAEHAEGKAVKDDSNAVILTPLNVLSSSVFREFVASPSVESLRALKRVAPFIGNDFDQVMDAGGRAYQADAVFIVVDALLNAIPSERHPAERQKMFDGITSVLIEGNKQLPRDRFFYTKSSKFGRGREVLDEASKVVWASIFLLDLFTYSASYEDDDVVANIFLFDEGMKQMTDLTLVNHFAALGYSMHVNAQMLAEFACLGIVKRAKGRGHGEAKSKGGARVNQEHLMKCLKGSLFHELFLAMAAVGFDPSFREHVNPRLQEFKEASTAKTSLAVHTFIKKMVNFELSDVDDLVDRVFFDLQRKEPLKLPLFVFAFGFHLRRSLLENCMYGQRLLVCKLVGASGTDVKVLDPITDKPIERLSFQLFRLFDSELFEVSLPKIACSSYARNSLYRLIGESEVEMRFGHRLNPYSFNFSGTDDDIRRIEAIVFRMARNHLVYLQNPRFGFVSKVLCDMIATVVSSAGRESYETAVMATTLAESLITDQEFNILMH